MTTTAAAAAAAAAAVTTTTTTMTNQQEDSPRLVTVDMLRFTEVSAPHGFNPKVNIANYPIASTERTKKMLWPCILFDSYAHFQAVNERHHALLFGESSSPQQQQDVIDTQIISNFLDHTLQHSYQLDDPVALLLGPPTCHTTTRLWVRPQVPLHALQKCVSHFVLTVVCQHVEGARDTAALINALLNHPVTASSSGGGSTAAVGVAPKTTKKKKTTSVATKETQEEETIAQKEPPPRRSVAVAAVSPPSTKQDRSSSDASSLDPSASHQQTPKPYAPTAVSPESDRRDANSLEATTTTPQAATPPALPAYRFESSGEEPSHVTLQDVQALLVQAGYTLGPDRFCRPGGGDEDESDELTLHVNEKDRRVFSTEREFRTHLCRYGLPLFGEWSEGDCFAIHEWVRYAVVTCADLECELPEDYDDDLTMRQVLRMMYAMGVTYRAHICLGNVLCYPGITPKNGILGENMFEKEEEMVAHLARFGLPQECNVSVLSARDHLSLELHLFHYLSVPDTFNYAVKVEPASQNDDNMSRRSSTRAKRARYN